jgi:hypothetical protein
MKRNKLNYSLYTDKEQTKLLAMAYSLAEAKKVSLEYTGGQWFSNEVDPENNKFYLEDTEKEVKLKFGTKKKEKKDYEDAPAWIGGAEVR